MKIFLAIVVLAGTALLAGCGDSGSAPTVIEEETAAGSERSGPDWTALEQAAGPAAGRLILPSGPPPRKMSIKDLRVGKGPAIKPKQVFGVNYVALDYKSGKVVQESWGSPTFQGAYRVGESVEAFEVGLRGMRVGGLRELIAPSYLAYGDGPLVYLIELVELGEVLP